MEVPTPTAACRPVLRRLFRPALQAQRRLDDDRCATQEKLDGRPCARSSSMCCNFSKGAHGEPTLLSFDDARTLFHEFGHALHGLLSNVTYPLISGTAVRPTSSNCRRSSTSIGSNSPRFCDEFARHYQTGEPMPEALLHRASPPRRLQPGLRNGRISSRSALVDLDFHSLPRTDHARRSRDFERDRLARIGMPEEIVMRHRPPHFAHVFSGRRLCGRLLQLHVVGGARRRRVPGLPGDRRRFRPGDRASGCAIPSTAAGGSRDPAEAYKAFRGRLPSADALLRKRGLAEPRRTADPDGPAQRRTPPRRRLRAASRRRRGRPRDPRRGRQRHRSDAGDGGDDRRRLSAHEPHRRRRLLAGARALRPRARADGGGPRRRQGQRRVLSRARLRHDSRRAGRSPRSPCRARSAAGCSRSKPRRHKAAAAARRAARSRDPPRPRRLCRHPQPGAARRPRSSPSSKDVPGLRRDLSASTASRRRPAAVLRQTALAATLDHLAHAGLDDFYRGDVGREIAADLERIGSPVTRADLEALRADVAEPLSSRSTPARSTTRRRRPRALPRSSFSPCSTRLRVAEAESFDHVHGLVEATKRAFRVRDRVVTDPDRLPQPLDTFSSRNSSTPRRRRSTAARRRRGRRRAGAGDTVWMGAADADGLVVSYIQSLYWEFGSGCVLPRTGVLMQNRGASFSLDPARSTRWRPAACRSTPSIRRSRCSRTAASWPTAPWAATASRRRRPRCSPATSLSAAARAALDAPRWLLGRTWGSTAHQSADGTGFDGNLIDRLMSAGHDVEVLDEPIPTPWATPAPSSCIPTAPRRRPRPARRRRRGGGVNKYPILPT